MTSPYISGANTKVATSAQWAASRHPLSKGRLGVASDTGVTKVGDGHTLWPSLPALPGGAGGASSADAVSYDPTSSGLDGDNVQAALDAAALGPGDTGLMSVVLDGTQPVPSGGSVALPFKRVVGAWGHTDWLGDGDYASPNNFAQTFPDRTWFSFPEGVYWVTLRANFAVPADGIQRSVQFVNATDELYGVPGWDDFYTISAEAFPIAIGYGGDPGYPDGAQQLYAQGLIRVKSDAAPGIWVALASQSNVGADPANVASAGITVIQLTSTRA